MKSKSRYIQLPALLLGAALFAYVLERTGIATILDKGRLLGLSFVFLILLSGARHALRALAWYGCVSRSERRLGLRDLFEMRLVGEAINNMTPAGPLLGETVKVWAASRTLSLRSSISSAVIENLIYGLAAALFMLSGLALLLLETGMSPRVRLVVGGLMMALFISMLVPYRIISRRRLLLSRILDRLKQRGWTWTFLDRYGENIRAYENSVHDFFSTRRNFFFYILLIEMVTNFTGIGEAYLILKATTAHASILAAYLVESANRAVQLIFAFIPFGLGVEEGAAAATLRAFGYSVSEGVALAVIRKIRTVFWAAVGLSLLAKYSIPKPAELGIGRGSA